MSLGINAQIDRSKAPKSGDAPEIKLPDANIWKLKNGLTIILVENHKLPTVNFSLRFDYDPILEGDKAGETSIFGAMMGAGTTTRKKEELNESIEIIGAQLRTSSKSISVSTLKKNYTEAFDILADVTLNPSFPQAEFDKEIKQMLSGLEANEKDNKAISNRVKSAILYGSNHPFGEVVTPETAKNLKLEDVKNLYSSYFKPNIAYLVVNGDITKKEVKKLVNTHFKNWKSAEVPSHKYEDPKNVDKTEIDFVNVDEATQSIISIVNLENLKPSSPDFFAARAGVTILGGSATARLFMNLREDKAYTYGAYCGLGSGKLISNFYAGASVRNEVTDSAVVQFIYEINKIRNEEVKAEELEKQKNSLFGSFAMTLESPATVASFYLNEQILGLPKGYYSNYLKEVNKVTPADVKQALNKYILPDNSRIIIVGKAVDVIPNLKKLGYKINYFDVYGRPTDAPSMAKPIPAGITVATVINDYADAIGGEKALKKIKTLNQDFSMKMGPYTIDGNIKKMAPYAQKMEMKMQGQVIMKNVFDGKKGYMMAQGQKMSFDEKQTKSALGSITIMPWLYFGEEKYNATLTNIVPVGNSEAYKMKVNIGDEVSFFYFDVNSKLLIQQENVKEVNGQKVSEITNLKDYKEFDGIKFPMLLQVNAGPQIMEMKVKSVIINKGVKASDFK
jgi:predicted Zn-dependent peptidase